jgi:hypothetical protein
MQAKNSFEALQNQQLQAIDHGQLANARHIETTVHQIQDGLKHLRKKRASHQKPNTVLREIQKIEQSIAAHALHQIEVSFDILLSAQEKQQLKSALFEYIGYELPHHFYKKTEQSIFRCSCSKLSKHKIILFFSEQTRAKWNIDNIFVDVNENIQEGLLSHSSSILQRLAVLKQQLDKG